MTAVTGSCGWPTGADRGKLHRTDRGKLEGDLWEIKLSEIYNR